MNDQPKERKNWSDAIPLVTLLAVVFGAGVICAQQWGLSSKLDSMATRVNEDHDRIVKLEALQTFARTP